MSEPSEQLRQLAAHGRKIRAEILALKQSRRNAGGKTGAAVDVLSYFFDLSGYKRTARRLGRVYVQSQVAQQEQELLQVLDEWAKSVRTALGRISVVKKSLGRDGNSSQLLGRFARTQRYVRPETNLSNGIALLEELAESHVVLNENLSEILKAPEEYSAAEPPPLPAQDVLETLEIPRLANLLREHPAELEALQGALTVQGTGTPDAGRQALGSCRNALENLVRRLSGEQEWSRGLEKLISAKTRRKTIRQVYSYLSAYGTHGVAVPRSDDVEFGIRLTLSAVKAIVDNSRLQ